MLSADYRAAVAAEAAGNVDLAAERYAWPASTRARCACTSRAPRAQRRAAEIAALRDAMRWAGDEPALRRQARGARPRAVGGGQGRGHRDRARQGCAKAATCSCSAAITSGRRSAREDRRSPRRGERVRRGGLVEKMEEALAKDDEKARGAREPRTRSPRTRPTCAIGRRDDARADLARAIATAPSPATTGACSISSTPRCSPADARRARAPRQAADRRVRRAEESCSAAIRCAISAARRRRVAPARRDRATAAAASSCAISTRATAPRSAGCRSSAACRSPAPAGSGSATSARSTSRSPADVLILRIAGGLDRGVALIAGAEGEPARPRAARAARSTRCSSAAGRCSAAAPRSEVPFNGEPLGDSASSSSAAIGIVADGDEIDIG